jgi:2-(3-amino-3-carboxypropyl)histidine synthase
MLQFPDGLLGEFCSQIINYFQSKNIEVLIAGDPSYGACDLPIHQAELLSVDAVIHFGHSTFAFPPPKSGIPIHYISVDVQVDIKWNLIHQEIQKLGWKSVGIVTTIQHTSILKQANQLTASGIQVKVHKEGQILGCNQNRAMKIAKQVDGFLVIAGGNFHASPIVVATNRSTLRYDPFNLEFKLYNKHFRDDYLKKRYAMIIKAREAKTWGVLLSMKSGQISNDHGKKLVKMLREAGKQVITVPMYRIDPHHLTNFEKIDAWVINLCPRIATDDFISFNKPILTTRELAVALGVLSWERFINSLTDNEEHLLILEI